MSSTKPRYVFRTWIPFALVSAILCGLVYIVVQQDLRQSANDPQIQLAEDAAAAIEQGKQPSDFLPTQTVDIGTSLAPFVTVYDDTDQPVVTSGNLNGAPPTLPAGVLDEVKAHGEDRITWQPQPGVRIAAVVTRVNSGLPGYVLAGRSLREVEIRESELNIAAGAALLVCWIVSLLAIAIFKKE